MFYADHIRVCFGELEPENDIRNLFYESIDVIQGRRLAYDPCTILNSIFCDEIFHLRHSWVLYGTLNLVKTWINSTTIVMFLRYPLNNSA